MDIIIAVYIVMAGGVCTFAPQIITMFRVEALSFGLKRPTQLYVHMDNIIGSVLLSLYIFNSVDLVLERFREPDRARQGGKGSLESGGPPFW